MAVLLETSIGDIVVDLYVDERPKCSLNFLKLCKIKYYNFSLFFSVQRSFIAQAGDPTGTGSGGESIWGVLKGEDYRYFDAEKLPRIKHQKLGTLSMVNNGNGCHGSQFFVTLGEELDYLDGQHTVFGEVAEGHDILMKFNEAYCDKEGRPYQDIRVYHTVVLEDPYPDPEGLKVPERSPSPPKVITDSNRIGAEEDIDDYKGLSEEQIKELVSKREAKANAQILEMIGDIPDADAKPPENVLFVCKLNPVTTDEDLEIIFSRFGPILSCEVIRDQKTGDSLQYAFIEFENEEDCVNAYFKMDNVLIDDRRIHVDFSQSLAKVKGIRKRLESEDKSADGQKKKDDGFVSTQKVKGGDGYEMVFDEDSAAMEKVSKKEKKQYLDVDKQRQMKHSSEKERERSGKSDRESRHKGEMRDCERNRKRRDSREHDRDRRSREEKRRRSRSRSRSRDRDHYSKHKRTQDRDRSRERHRRH